MRDHVAAANPFSRNGMVAQESRMLFFHHADWILGYDIHYGNHAKNPNPKGPEPHCNVETIRCGTGTASDFREMAKSKMSIVLSVTP